MSDHRLAVFGIPTQFSVILVLWISVTCKDFSVPSVSYSGFEAAGVAPLHPYDPVEQSGKTTE